MRCSREHSNNIMIKYTQVTGPLVALSHSCTQRVIRSADQHGGFYEEFFATPKAETHRQGVSAGLSVVPDTSCLFTYSGVN